MGENLTQRLYDIHSLSKKGRGLALGKVEIPGTLPSEVVLAEPAGRKRAFLRRVVEPSSERVSPKCGHCPDCGGCAIQQMEYSAQLLMKQSWVEELFDEEVKPIIGCENPFYYRNKMEFSFSEDRAGNRFLGLMLAGSRGRVFNLEECHLVSEWFSKTVASVKHFWEQSHLRAYRHASDEGHLRTLTLREAVQGKGKMVMLTVSGNPEYALSKGDLREFVRAIQQVESEEELSVFIQVQQLAKGRPTQFYEMLLLGPDHITETLEVVVKGARRKLDFKISPTSFFQPNTRQAEVLYSEALSMVEHLSGARLVDLYCGGATLGLLAAPFAKEVVGIELNPHSVFDARWSQEVNRIENFEVIQGDVGEVLERLNIPFDVAIVDPPRAGLSNKAIAHLIAAQPKEILYISCNPKTQVANVADLKKAGFRVKAIQPVDQFPHTVHIENIVHLQYP